MSVAINFLTMFDDSGLKKVKKGLKSLDAPLKHMKHLMGGMGLALVASATAITHFSISAAKAAQADAKSQMLLSETLKRTAYATKTQVKQSEAFIQTLSNQVGILDDNLRPALAGMARVTGDAGKAQKLLKIALDASALSGKPLATVSTAVQKAYVGNTTALKKMFPELVKVEDKFVSLHGKAKTLADKTKLAAAMLSALGMESAGLAAKKADPFEKLGVAVDNLKEKFGALILPKLTEFLNGLMAPGGAVDQVSAFIDQMGDPKTDAGKAFRDITVSVGQLGDTLAKLFGSFDPSGKGNSLVGLLNTIKTAVDNLNTAIDVLSGQALIRNFQGATFAVAQIGSLLGAKVSGKGAPTAENVAAVSDKFGFGAIVPDSVRKQMAARLQNNKSTNQRGTVVNQNITIQVQGASPAEQGKQIAKSLEAYQRAGGNLRALTGG